MGAIPLLGAGVVKDVGAGVYKGGSETPKTEVIINIALLDGDNFLVNENAIYYINDPDYLHYREKHNVKEKTYTVVNQ